MIHGREVYSPIADALVREIALLADDRTRRKLQERLIGEFNEYDNPDVKNLERVLTEWRDRLKTEARDRGFEG